MAGTSNIQENEKGSSSSRNSKEETPAAKKLRKPYTITKSRETWSETEHEKFLEALQLFDRDWKKIEAFVGTKTVIQIRSHAQKHFLKLAKNGTAECIPPPRPKRKSGIPYPHKAAKSPSIAGDADDQGFPSLSASSQPASSSLQSPAVTSSRNCQTAPSTPRSPLPPTLPHTLPSHGLFGPAAVLGPPPPPLSPYLHGTVMPTPGVPPNAASPDFPSVYSFIGSVFDPSCGVSDHRAKLRSMAPVDRETTLLLMRNLSVNLSTCDLEALMSLLPKSDPSIPLNEPAGAPMAVIERERGTPVPNRPQGEEGTDNDNITGMEVDIVTVATAGRKVGEGGDAGGMEGLQGSKPDGVCDQSGKDGNGSAANGQTKAEAQSSLGEGEKANEADNSNKGAVLRKSHSLKSTHSAAAAAGCSEADVRGAATNAATAAAALPGSAATAGSNINSTASVTGINGSSSNSGTQPAGVPERIHAASCGPLPHAPPAGMSLKQSLSLLPRSISSPVNSLLLAQQQQQQEQQQELQAQKQQVQQLQTQGRLNGPHLPAGVGGSGSVCDTGGRQSIHGAVIPPVPSVLPSLTGLPGSSLVPLQGGGVGGQHKGGGTGGLGGAGNIAAAMTSQMELPLGAQAVTQGLLQASTLAGGGVQDSTRSLSSSSSLPYAQQQYEQLLSRMSEAQQRAFLQRRQQQLLLQEQQKQILQNHQQLRLLQQQQSLQQLQQQQQQQIVQGMEGRVFSPGATLPSALSSTLRVQAGGRFRMKGIAEDSVLENEQQHHLESYLPASQSLGHRFMLAGGVADGTLQDLSPQQQQQQQRQEAFTTAESQLMQQLLRDPMAQSAGSHAALDRSPVPPEIETAIAASLASGASFSAAVAAAAGGSAAASLALQGGSTSGIRDSAVAAALAARLQWNRSPGAQPGVLGQRAMDFTTTAALHPPLTSASLSQEMLRAVVGPMPLPGADAVCALRGSYTTMGRQEDAVAGFLRHAPRVPIRSGSQTSSGGMPAQYIPGGLGLPTITQGEQFAGVGIPQDMEMKTSEAYAFPSMGGGPLSDFESALGSGVAPRPTFPFISEDLSLFDTEGNTDVGFGSSSMMKGMDSMTHANALSWGPTPFME